MLNTLAYSRIMALALNEMCSQLGLGNMAIHVDGENTNHFAVLGDEVRYYDSRGKLVAVAEVTDSASTADPSFNLYIEWFDLFDLIRPEHVGEFEPQLYGLHVNRSRNWLGEKMPDIIVETVVEASRVRTGPARPLPVTEFKTEHLVAKGSV